MIDLSGNGATLPLIVAAVAGLLAWLFLSRRGSASGNGSPAESAGPLASILGLLGGNKVSVITLLIAVWNNRAAILAIVSKAWESLKPILAPQAAPTVQPEKKGPTDAA